MDDNDLEIEIRCGWCGVTERLMTSSAGIALLHIDKFHARHYRCKEESNA